MIQNLLSTLGQMDTVFLLLALVVLFVVAFKLLEMVTQTFLVTALSGLFYFAFTYFVQSVSFSLNSMLFFAFTGGTLYTAYSLLTSSVKLVSLLVKIPFMIIGIIKKIFGLFINFDKLKRKEKKNP